MPGRCRTTLQHVTGAQCALCRGLGAPAGQCVTENPPLGPCQHTGSARGQLSQHVCGPWPFQGMC